MTHSVLLLPLILTPLIFLPPEERHAKHLPFAGTHTHSMLPTAFYLTFSLPRASLTGSLGQASAVELSLFHFLASLAIPGIADGTHGPYSQAAQDSTCSLNKKKIYFHQTTEHFIRHNFKATYLPISSVYLPSP